MMATGLKSPCIVRSCREMAAPGQSRCPQHRPKDLRKRVRPQYDSTWQKIAKEAVAKYQQVNGNVCNGYERPPHEVVLPNRLSADHITPVARGGTNDPMNIDILCVSCNSRKRDRT